MSSSQRNWRCSATDKAANYLGLMRKAGRIALGEHDAGAAARAGKACLLLLAQDASDNARKRAEGFAHAAQAPLLRLPRFMEEQQMTGAQIGTAFHRMMRMLDLDALRATHDLAAEIDRQRAALLEKGVVSENELAAVHPRLLVRLFASPLGVRMLAAGELHREWAFTYRRETEDGAQLLQGVIDCCFIERGAWVLVDYKTDADAAGAIERHRPQLELYAQALAGITGRPVRERVLYLVRAGMGYQV